MPVYRFIVCEIFAIQNDNVAIETKDINEIMQRQMGALGRLWETIKITKKMLYCYTRKKVTSSKFRYNCMVLGVRIIFEKVGS